MGEGAGATEDEVPAQSEVEGTATPDSKTIVKEAKYRLPSWFLDETVNAPSILTETTVEVRIRLTGADDESSSDEAIDADGEAEETEKPNTEDHRDEDWPGFYVARDEYAEIRDIAASKLHRDAYGRAPASSSILLRSTTVPGGGQDFLDEVVLHLARDLNSKLMVLDADAIEELAWDFFAQEREAAARPSTDTKGEENKEGDGNAEKEELHFTSFKGPIIHYFGNRGKGRCSEEAWDRNRDAFAALSVAITAPSSTLPISPCNGERGEVEGEDPSKSSDLASSPLLIHFRDAARMMDVLSDHYKFWSRLRDWVARERQSDRDIILIVTLSGTKYEMDYRWEGFGKLKWKLRVDGAADPACITLEPSHIPAKLADERKDWQVSYTRAANIRRLRSVLCTDLSHRINPSLLQQRPVEWSEKLRCLESSSKRFALPSSSTFGTTTWSTQQLYRIRSQITGRAWSNKKAIGFEDIQLVIARAGRLEAKAEEGGASSDTNDSRSESAWEKKIREVRRDCNEYEETLLSSVVDSEELDSTYEDVILDDDVKTTVKCLVGISKLRVQVTSKYLSSQMQVKGAMLYGPPGTGKTHLARALAKSVGSTMLAVDCATLQSKWVGETEKLIKATFTLARKLSPCVVFIDEVDALFRRRTSSDRSWERSAITQFLQDMDGLRQNATTVAATTPFVLVATNRPMDLDDAFMRRLPQKFYIGLPSRAARAKILNLFLDKDDLDASVNIEDLARRTEGYSGSDLRSLSAQAALVWTTEQGEAALQKDSSKGSEDADEETSLPVVKMQLTSSHFTRALETVRPSVTKRAMKDLEEFRNSFNPTSSRKKRRQSIKESPVRDAPETPQITWDDLAAPGREGRLVLPVIRPPPDCLQKARLPPEYSPLPTSSSIRLLRLNALEATIHRGVQGVYQRLLSGELDMFERIKCSMVTVDLENSPDFFALSYTWGDPLGIWPNADDLLPAEHWAAPAFEIDCDGKPVSVGTNLYTALVGIRCVLSYSSFRPSGLPTSIPAEFDCSADPSGLYIWIDALCINQADIAEREQQVSLMDRIYSAARATIMWIGGEDPLATVAAPMTKFSVPLSSNLGSLWALDIGSPASYEKLGLDPISKTEWTGLLSMLTRPYFSRAWVVQEWVLSKAPIMMCGLTILDPRRIATNTITMHDLGWFRQMTGWLDLRAVKEDGTSSKPQMPPPSPPGAEPQEVLLPVYRTYKPNAPAAVNLTVMQSILLMKGYEIPHLFPKKAGAEANYDFQSFRNTDSTDPRDKLFAFLGLLKHFSQGQTDSLKPEYTRSAQEVYTEAMKRMISASPVRGLNLLVWKEPKAHLTGLPSWVPDFSMPHHSLTQGPVRFGASRGLGSHAAIFEPLESQSPSQQNGALRTKGIRVDTIVATYNTENLRIDFDTALPQLLRHLPEKTTIRQPRLSGFDLRFWWDMFYTEEGKLQTETFVVAEQGRFEVLWRTLLADIYLTGEDLAAEQYPCPPEKASALRHELDLMVRACFLRIASRDVISMEDLLHGRRPQDKQDDQRHDQDDDDNEGDDDEEKDEEEENEIKEPGSMRAYFETLSRTPGYEGFVGPSLTDEGLEALRQQLPAMHVVLGMLDGNIPFSDCVEADKHDPPDWWVEYQELWEDVQQDAQNNPQEAFKDFMRGLEKILSQNFNEITDEAPRSKAVRSSQWRAGWFPGQELFATSGGRLGLAHDTIRVGDEVWVLPGADIPFVFRPEDPAGCASTRGGRCRLVGESYVHGLMHGDASMLELSLEEILIV